MQGALLTQSFTHPHYAPIQPLCEKWAARKISVESFFVAEYSVSTASFLLTFSTGFIGLKKKKPQLITTIRQTRQRLRSWSLCFSVGHHKSLLWRNRISTFVCKASVFPKGQSIHNCLAGLTQSFRWLCRNRNRSLVYSPASCKLRQHSFFFSHKGACRTAPGLTKVTPSPYISSVKVILKKKTKKTLHFQLASNFLTVQWAALLWLCHAV